MTTIRPSDERGFALVTAMILAGVLMTLALSSLTYSRSDSLVSDNAKSGSTASWLAQLGSDRVKNFLRKDAGWRTITGPTTLYPVGTTHPAYPGASYASTVRPYGVGPTNKFLIDSTANAGDGSSIRIQEVVALPTLDLQLGAINLHGTGTHTKMNEPNLAMPAWFIDARNHDRHGQPVLSGPGQYVRPGFRGTQDSISNPSNPTAIQRELCDLRNGMITAGNSCTAQGNGACNGEKRGSNGDGAGRFFVHGLGASTCSCNSNILCNEATLDLADPRLNAITHEPSLPPVPPTHGDTAWADDPAGTPFANPQWVLGPLVANPATEVMNPTENAALAQSIERILEFALNSKVRDRRAILSDITSDTTTGATGTSSDPNRFGSWDNPVFAILCDPGHSNPKMRRLSSEPPCNGNSGPNVVQVKTSAARLAGTGILIIGRTVEVGNRAQFNWRGIVLVLDSGRVNFVNINGNNESCGMVLGTTVLQADSSGNYPKLRFADAEHRNCPNPYVNEPVPASAVPSEVATIHGIGVKYSQESIENALTAGLIPLAWHEVYENEDSL